MAPPPRTLTAEHRLGYPSLTKRQYVSHVRDFHKTLTNALSSRIAMHAFRLNEALTMGPLELHRTVKELLPEGMCPGLQSFVRASNLWRHGPEFMKDACLAGDISAQTCLNLMWWHPNMPELWEPEMRSSIARSTAMHNTGNVQHSHLTQRRGFAAFITRVFANALRRGRQILND